MDVVTLIWSCGCLVVRANRAKCTVIYLHSINIYTVFMCVCVCVGALISYVHTLRVYMATIYIHILHLHLSNVVPPNSLFTEGVTARIETDLEPSQGPRRSPRGPCSMLFPWIMSARVPLRSEGWAAGDHMLDVMHGYTDKNVRGHAFVQTVTPPRSILHCHVHDHTHTLSKPPGNTLHCCTFWHVRHRHQIESYHPVRACTDWCRPEPHSHLDLQLNKSPLPSSTFPPSPPPLQRQQYHSNQLDYIQHNMY